MIAEERRPLLAALVRRVMRRRLARGLSALRVLGLEGLAALARERPVILAGNHVAFWDGFLCELLSSRAQVEPRALMLASRLREAPLLRWVGAFGVEEDDARDGVRALSHAARFLSCPGRVLWIFPQGRQRPQWARPLGFRGGAALLARRVPQAALVPFAFHYELGEREQPEAWVQFGAPLAEPAALEPAVLALLGDLQRAVLEGRAVPSLLAERRRLGEGAATRLLSLVAGAPGPGKLPP